MATSKTAAASKAPTKAATKAAATDGRSSSGEQALLRVKSLYQASGNRSRSKSLTRTMRHRTSIRVISWSANPAPSG